MTSYLPSNDVTAIAQSIGTQVCCEVTTYMLFLQANEIARLIRQYITIDQRNRAINNPSAAAEEKENEEGKQD